MEALTRIKSRFGRSRPSVVPVAALLLMAVFAFASTGAGAARVATISPPVTPTKALCKQASYKIGYDVFSVRSRSPTS